jgi:hypothetical protein
VVLREQSLKFALHIASGETLLILKEALVTLWRRPLTTWVFIANITDEFILGLDVLSAQNASVDLKDLVRQMGREEVPLQRPEAQPCSPHIGRVAPMYQQLSVAELRWCVWKNPRR